MGWTDNRRKAEVLPAHQPNQAELIPSHVEAVRQRLASRILNLQHHILPSTRLPSQTGRYNEHSF